MSEVTVQAMVQAAEDVEVLANTLETLGTIELLAGVPEGRAKLDQLEQRLQLTDGVVEAGPQRQMLLASL